MSARGTAMPIDVSLPLIDHHCHGLVPRDLTRREFERMISESFVDAPAGTSHFDAPVGLAIRARCAALGAAAVNRRFVEAANCSLLLIDTGFRSNDILTPAGMTAATGAPAREVVRIEAVAEQVGRSGVGGGDYPAAFADALAAAAKDAVGLKSIVAYRGGFAFDPRPPTKAEVVTAAGCWLPEIQAGRARMEESTLLRHGLWVAADLARQRGLPIQFHVGYGDRDARIHLNNPSLLMDFFEELNRLGVNVVLLHCYPFHREAGYLAEVFPNVFFDVGEILHYTGAS